jgi:hypothetical protein
MKREEVLSLLGQPLSVSAIQGLDTPRETWTYQVAFGKQLYCEIGRRSGDKPGPLSSTEPFAFTLTRKRSRGSLERSNA